MNRLMMNYPVMDEAPAPGGEGGGGGEQQPTQQQPTQTQEAKPVEGQETKNLLDGDDPQPGAGEDGAEAKKDPTSLLDDEEEQKPVEGQEQKPVEENAPTEEQIKAWTDGVKATDLGDGLKWDDVALTAITPELMRLSNNDPKKAEGLIKAYTKHQQAQLKAFQESQDRFNTELISQCKAKFGDDLKKIAGYARIGGREVFGDKIWNEMKKVPQFANNPEILERLAMIGRKTATDGGKVTPKAGEPEAEGDVLHRMYGNVKV